MSNIRARTLFQIPLEEIIELKKDLTLMFDDGVIVHAAYKDVILFRYIMDFIPNFNVELTSDLWITNYYTNGFFTNKTYLNMYSVIFEKIGRSLDIDDDGSALFNQLFKDMYKAIDTINKHLIKNIINYVIGVEIEDVLDIQFDNDLLQSIIDASNNPSTKSIENTYETLDNVITKDKFNNNPLQQLYLSKSVNVDQLRQLLASRGYVTEIDSKIYNKPMVNSLTLGFKNMYDAAIESRAGAKAMFLSSKAIQDSEYMARELQLAIMFIERVEHTDCGNKSYEDFYVRPKEFDSFGNLIYQGDLKNIVGKRYLDTDGIEKIITKNDTHLEGTYIKMRMAVYCKLMNKKKICSACIGEISRAILDNQNLGHIMTTNASAEITQSILSTKHLLKSANSAPVRLDAVVKKYFMLKNNEKVFFKANVLNKKVKQVFLKFKQSEAWGIDNILEVKDIFSININKISRLSEVILVFKSKNSVTEIPITLKSGSRFAYFTIDFLSYIIKNGYEIYDEENYIIDINKYDKNKPIFMYEKVEFNFAALAKEFKSLLKTRKYKMVDGVIRSEYRPHVLVQKLFALINNKLDVNIALLDVMVYAFTVQNLNEYNYDLGRNTPHKDIIGFREAIDYRTVGPSYGWDDLVSKVLDPILYKREHKCAHPMDVFFCPNEVVKYDTNDVE